MDWIDVCLGGMRAVEAYTKYHASGRLARPTIVLAVVMFGVGIFHGRIAAAGDRLRELRVTDKGVSVPGRFFRRLTLRWDEIAEITIGPHTARVIAIDGRDQSINLADAIHAAPLRDALAVARDRLASRHLTSQG